MLLSLNATWDSHQNLILSCPEAHNCSKEKKFLPETLLYILVNSYSPEDPPLHCQRFIDHRADLKKHGKQNSLTFFLLQKVQNIHKSIKNNDPTYISHIDSLMIKTGTFALPIPFFRKILQHCEVFQVSFFHSYNFSWHLSCTGIFS